MKTLLALLLGLSFSAAVVGCSASATVDPNHDTGAARSSEKTTVVSPNGSTETHTEVHTNP